MELGPLVWAMLGVVVATLVFTNVFKGGGGPGEGGKGGGGGGGGGWSCQTAVFSADGDVLFTGGGGGGKVQVWDLRRRCCAHTWHDSGGLRCTALDVSADGEYLAAQAEALRGSSTRGLRGSRGAALFASQAKAFGGGRELAVTPPVLRPDRESMEHNGAGRWP